MTTLDSITTLQKTPHYIKITINQNVYLSFNIGFVTSYTNIIYITLIHASPSRCHQHKDRYFAYIWSSWS